MLSTSRLCDLTGPYARKHLPSMAALGFVSAAPPAPTTPLKAPRSASASTASGLGGTHVLAVSATGGILLAVRRTRQRSSAKSRASASRVACKGQLLDKVEKKEQAPKAPKELKEQPAQAVASSSHVPMLWSAVLLACGVLGRLGTAKEAPFFELAQEKEEPDPGPVESRLEDLVAQLTVEEKILQLSNDLFGGVPSVDL
eukprot:s351_g34.t1